MDKLNTKEFSLGNTFLPKIKNVAKKINEIIDYITAREYKEYIARLSQSGTNAPTATVIKNTIGTITWSYTALGAYTATSNYLFTTNKTVATMSGRLDIGLAEFVCAYPGSALHVHVETGILAGNNANDILDGEIIIEIRVYN